MSLPGYFLPRPPIDLAPATLAQFEQLHARYVAPAAGAEIDYSLDVPRWQFLCWLAATKGVLLHGSSEPDIEQFEPHQAIDVNEFGAQQAVYAASDGIWPIFFGIVDRRLVTSLVDCCFYISGQEDEAGRHYYYFSLDQSALPHQPWRNAMIYALPRATFVQEPPQRFHGHLACVTQWASQVPVKPLARLAVTPADFPFLDQVNGHDPATLTRRAAADPTAFPWRD